MRKRVPFLFLITFLFVGAAGRSPDGVSSTGFRHDRITLSFAGDLMSHVENVQSIPYDASFAMVTPHLEASDLAFVNFEFVLDPNHAVAGYPRFNAPFDYASAALDAGFDVVSLANNHSADLGETGVQATLDSMELLARDHAVRWSGTVRDPDSRFEATVLEIDGIEIGYLAATSFLNRGIRSDHVNIADYLNGRDRSRLLDAIRKQAPWFDLFVLSYHGGAEYANSPDAARVRFFEDAIGAGVDILWGHHSHVLQRWEQVSSGDRVGLVMYSLGNFNSGQSSHIDLTDPYDARALRGESAIVEVTLSRRVETGEDGRAVTSRFAIASIDAIPIVHLPDRNGSVMVAPVDLIDALDLSDARRRFMTERLPTIEATPQFHLSIPDLP